MAALPVLAQKSDSWLEIRLYRRAPEAKSPIEECALYRYRSFMRQTDENAVKSRDSRCSLAAAKPASLDDHSYYSLCCFALEMKIDFELWIVSDSVDETLCNICLRNLNGMRLPSPCESNKKKKNKVGSRRIFVERKNRSFPYQSISYQFSLRPNCWRAHVTLREKKVCQFGLILVDRLLSKIVVLDKK